MLSNIFIVEDINISLHIGIRNLTRLIFKILFLMYGRTYTYIYKNIRMEDLVV